jgi:hypothetical protein
MKRTVTVPLHRVSEADRQFVAEQTGTALQQPSAMLSKTIALDFASPVYIVKVVPQNARLQNVLCDIAVKGSDVIVVDKNRGEVLIKNGQMIKSGIKPGEKFRFMFPPTVAGAKIDVHVKCLKCSNSVSLQLRPTITKKGLSKQQRRLERLLAAAGTVNQNLPAMQQVLGALVWDYNIKVAAARNAHDPLEQTRANRDASRLSQRIAKLRQQIADARKLIANQPAMARELNGLLAVGEHARQLASQVEVHVRIHDGRQTLLAQNP